MTDLRALLSRTLSHQQQETRGGLGPLIQGSDPTDEVARRFGKLVDRLTDAELYKTRAPDVTDAQWDRMKTVPSFREHARKKLFEETPPEAWDIQRAKLMERVLQEQLLQAKRKRIEEIRLPINTRLREQYPDMGDDEFEVASIREINKVLNAGGFGVIPAFKSEFKRTFVGEAMVAMTRGYEKIEADARSYYSDLLGQAAEKMGHDDMATQFYASGAGARERGAGQAERFKQSEDIKVFEPSNPRWWAARIGENIPQFALMMAGGAAVGAAGRAVTGIAAGVAAKTAVGTTAKAAAVAKAVGVGAKATKAFQKVIVSGGIGSLEAASAYDSSLEQLTDMGIPIGQARGLASEQALVVGAVNAVLESIAVGEFVGKVPGGRGRLIRAIRGAIIEGSTEGLQETTAIMGEAYAKAKATGSTTAQALAEMGRPVPGEIERILASFAIGAAIGGPVGGVRGGGTSKGPSVSKFGPAGQPQAQTHEIAPQASHTIDPAEQAPLEGVVQAERATTEAAPRQPLAEQPVTEVVDDVVKPFKRQEGEAPVRAPEVPAEVMTQAQAEAAPKVTETEAPVYDYRPESKPSVSDLGDIRIDMKARSYPPNRVVHTTTLRGLEGISKLGVQPNETIDNELGVSASWTNASGNVTGAALSYGGAGVPVVLVFKPDVETRGSSTVGDTLVKSTGKSYVSVSDIEGVYVGADPKFYTLTEARETYGDLTPEVPKVAEVAEPIEPAVPPVGEAELEMAIMETETPAEVEAIPIGPDPLDGPDTLLVPGEGTSVLATNLGDEVRRILRDESGGFDVQVMGRLIAGGIRTTADEASIIHAGLAALTDETTPLRRTTPGALAVEIVDSAITKSDAMTGRLTMAFQTAWKNLSRVSRRWLNTIREDGQTNYVTLIEHPDRISEAIPDDIRAILAVHATMMQETGDEAERVGIPQQKRDGTIGPFKKASAGRFIRFHSPDFAEALELQSGPVWDALIDWLIEHPERNPHLPSDKIELRSRLQGDRKSGTTKKLGSLEYTRTFKELPVTLVVEGKRVPVQEARPWHHFRAAVVSQSRLIYFHEEVQDRLLPQYGTFNRESGKMEFPHRANPKLIDMDGLWDSLRHDTVQAAKRPKTAQKAFNRLSENYYRHHYGGHADQLIPLRHHSRLIRGLAIAYRNIQASLISLSGIYDIVQPLKGIHRVGGPNILRAYVETTADIVFNKKKRLAEHQAIGAVRDGYTDWSIRPGQRLLDLTGKGIPQAVMWFAEKAEVWSQAVSARATELWINEVNGKLGTRDANLLKEDLRLTDDEVLQVARGEMTPAIKTKVIQNGVKIANYLKEDPHRRGLLRNKPLLRWLIPFTSMLNGSTRETGRIMTHITEGIEGVKQNRDADAWENLIQASTALIKFVVVCAGAGFTQKYLRRLITGRPIIDPEDPDEWYKIAFEALGEGAIFGPYYRILEAGKYSGGDPYRYAINLAPSLSIILEAATAITATGKYENSPWGDRLERAGLRFSPAGRAFRNWYDKFVWPERGEYKRTRSLVRKFNKDRGVETRYGGGPRNPLYYQIFEAVRDNNEAAATEAVLRFKQWSRDNGVDSEQARTGLRSSLQSRRPINLKQDLREGFLETLPEQDRLLAEQVQRRYNKLVEKYTGTGPSRFPPSPPRAPRPTMREDWYGTQ